MEYGDIPFLLALVFLAGGLAALAWSSDFFIDGASGLARRFGISPFIIGMVIIGFGTSAPELVVSAISGLSGHSSMSLGNAYGSCIFNIFVILGVAALIKPILCKPSVTFAAVPVLVAISVFSWLLLRDGSYSRSDALWQLLAFAAILPLYCWYDQRGAKKPAGGDGREQAAMGLWLALFKLVVGLAMLVGSSHFLVWGAVDTARMLWVSELLIGLTVLACGTSLPELASAVASARKGEHEFVLGNIIGSNLFNTLAVVGIAGGACPIEKFSPFILSRDLPIMIGASLSIAFFGVKYSKPAESGRIVRAEGALWILAYFLYTVLLIIQEV
jgi:cation:H+ antiporter